MKKEILLCDRCGRKINDGEYHISKPHHIKPLNMEDVCDTCYVNNNPKWATTTIGKSIKMGLHSKSF